MLIFTYNPSISSTSTTLDPQTIVISQAGAANISFLCQGVDLIMDEGVFSAKNQAATTKSSFDNNGPSLSSFPTSKTNMHL
jgi:hypothetical protein